MSAVRQAIRMRLLPGFLAGLLALVTLGSWLLPEVWSREHGGLEAAITHPGTAFVGLLAAVGLSLPRRRRHLALGRLLGVAIMVLALMRFLPPTWDMFRLGPTGGMSGLTALMLGLAGLSIYLLNMGRAFLAQVAVFLVLSLLCIELVDLYYGHNNFRGRMDVPSLWLGLLLSLAALMHSPHRGIIRILMSGRETGRKARIDLAVGVLGPLVIGQLHMAMMPEFQGAAQVSLIVVSIICFDVVAISFNTLFVERADMRRRNLERRLMHQAMHDGLTGVYNRSVLKERFRRLRTRAETTGEPFSMLLIDLDHFKAVNDAGGHDLGDRVLIRVSGAIREALNRSDVVSRVGGEEFAVLLPGAALPVAMRVAEHLAEVIRTQAVTRRDGRVQRVTASIGVGEWAGGEALRDLFTRCDLALYRAKEQGRNCVRMAPGRGQAPAPLAMPTPEAMPAPEAIAAIAAGKAPAAQAVHDIERTIPPRVGDPRPTLPAGAKHGS